MFDKTFRWLHAIMLNNEPDEVLFPYFTET